jgi:CHAT domain-containing protein
VGAPLVYITPTGRGGLGIIVHETGDVDRLFLPELTLDTLRDRTNSYLSAYQARSYAPGAWHAQLDDVTHWLWDAAMAPLIEVLGQGQRAVIVPFAHLGMLPLHAAWREDRAAPTGRRYALDELIVSYAPNARMLIAARQAATIPLSSALVVEDPRPVSGSPLPNSKFEAEFVKRAIPLHTHLSGDAATLAAVTESIGKNALLHFACHGVADLEAPLRSRLLLSKDQHLTLKLVLDNKLRARLAVLSACETAAFGVRLLNEALGFPAGLLQAGVAGVIASLWSVPDASTMELMIRFYDIWRSGHSPTQEGRTPADALREAQIAVRDSTAAEKIEYLGNRLGDFSADPWRFWSDGARINMRPNDWAAFVHIGA